MDQFIISTEDCLVLKALKDSASLREAAKRLHCDPAGIARRIRNIADNHHLVQKIDGHWKLTQQGLELVKWTERSIQSQAEAIYGKENIRLACASWFASSLVYPRINSLIESFENKVSFKISTYHHEIEKSLMGGELDFVICCHAPFAPEIAHKKVFPEQWRIVVPKNWRKDLIKKNKDQILSYLESRPFVRHADLNLDFFLPELSTDRKESPIIVDNVLAVKDLIQQEVGWSIFPEIVFNNEKSDSDFYLLDYPIHTKDRFICIWWSRDQDKQNRQTRNKIINWLKP